MERPCSHKLEHCFVKAGEKLRTKPCIVEEAREMQLVSGKSYLEVFPATHITTDSVDAHSNLIPMPVLKSVFIPIQTLDPITVSFPNSKSITVEITEIYIYIYVSIL